MCNYPANRAMRLAKVTISFLLVIFVAGTVVLYCFLDQLVSYGLQKIGAEEVTVHIAHIDFEQVHIERLDAIFGLANNEKIPIRLRNVFFRYNLKQLIRSGKFAQIDIETVLVSRLRGENKLQKSFRLPEQIVLLNDELREKIPTDKIIIGQLQLQGDVPSLLSGKRIHLTMDFDGASVAATVNIQVEPDTKISLTVQSPDALHATINCVAQRQNIQIAHVECALRPERLSGKLNLQLQNVLDLLQDSMEIPSIPVMDGNLHGTFRLSLPLQEDSMAQAEITVQDYLEHEFRVTVAGNPNTQQAHLVLVGRVGEKEIVNTNLSITEQGVSGDYFFQASPVLNFLRPYLKKDLPHIKGDFTGTLRVPMIFDKDHTFSATAKATSLIVSKVRGESVRLEFVGWLEGTSMILGSDSWLYADNLRIGENEIQNVSMNIGGRLTRNDKKMMLEFLGTQTMMISGMTVNQLHIPSLNLKFKKPLQIFFQNNFWSVAANTLHTTAPVQVSDQKQRCEMDSLSCMVNELRKTPTGIELHVVVDIPTVNLKRKKMQLSLKDLSGVIRLQNNRLAGKLQVAPEAIPGRLKLTCEHNINTAVGACDISTDRRFDLSEEGVTLANVFGSWKYPFNLDSGKVSLKASGFWNPETSLQFSVFVAVTGGSGYYKDFLFNGLNVRQDLALLPDFYSKTGGSFSLEKLIGAIDINHIRSNVNFRATPTGQLPQIEISDFSASLFGGTVSAPSIGYDLNLPNSDFVVNVQSVDLKKLIDEVKMDTLHVSGKVSGSIPVRIQGKKISVDNGELFSELPGGEIHYTSSTMNPSGATGYALKAVENLRYDSLTATAKYQPSGQLDLDMHLKGTSPSLHTSRPVQLNIHAEQNLPDLLQSLRFSKGLTDELDKRIKQHYN